MHVGETPDPMAKALITDFPEFKKAFPIYSSYDHSISVGDQLFETDILFLMSKEFIVLTVIGFLISIPIAYYFVNAWLEGFAYTIKLEW